MKHGKNQVISGINKFKLVIVLLNRVVLTVSLTLRIGRLAKHKITTTACKHDSLLLI